MTWRLKTNKQIKKKNKDKKPLYNPISQQNLMDSYRTLHLTMAGYAAHRTQTEADDILIYSKTSKNLEQLKCAKDPK